MTKFKGKEEDMEEKIPTFIDARENTKEALMYILIDNKTGKEIRDVVRANTETGEYEQLVMVGHRIVMDSNKEPKTKRLKGDISFRKII
jgi:hypothetical protein